MRGFPEWTKLPADVRDVLSRSEDYLTAHTLGLLRFCTDSMLVDLLGELGFMVGPAGPISLELWPALAHVPPELSEELAVAYCEPDALILGSQFACVVEAKFLGSQLGHYRSQLPREWLLGESLAHQHGWNGPFLLMVTNDLSAPLVPGWFDPAARVTIAEQISEFTEDMANRGLPITHKSSEAINRTLKWLSWSELTIAVQRVTLLAQGANARVLAEVCKVLETFGCTRFSGWNGFDLDPIATCPGEGEIIPLGNRRLFDFAKIAAVDAEIPTVCFLRTAEKSIFCFDRLMSIPPPQSTLFGGL